MQPEKDGASPDADDASGADALPRSGGPVESPAAAGHRDDAVADDTDATTPIAVEAVEAVANAAQDIGAFIRSQRVAGKVSLRQLAERAGVSNPYLSQIERGLRKPSAEVLAQIAKGLRVSAEVLYVRAGILEERPASPVRDALIADDSINERQKQMLLEIYESFRKENTIESTGKE